MRTLLAPFLIALTLSPGALAREGGGVSGGGGGGDLPKLAVYADLTPTESLTDAKYYRDWFIRAGLDGLRELQPLIWIGYEFKGLDGTIRTISPEQLLKTQELLLSLRSTSEDHFQLDETLVNPETQKPRMAYNAPGGFYKLHPKEWDQELRSKYSQTQGDNIRKSVALHEVFSQPEIGLEKTGDFTFSSLVLRAPELADGQEQFLRIARAIFKEPNPEAFYSCEAQLFEKTGDKARQIWRAPIPIATYVSWSVGQNPVETIDGRAVAVNPNYVPGATNGCYTDALERARVAKPYMVSQEVLKHLPSIDSGRSYLDICYVMSDAGDGEHFGGSARFLLRRIDRGEPWYNFRYVTRETRIEGKGSTELDYQNFKMKFSCDRVMPNPG